MHPQEFIGLEIY